MFDKLRRFCKRAWRANDGATALELALVLPIFVAIVFGTFEFGRAQHKLSSIRYAMTTASRALMLNPNLTQTQLSNLVKADQQVGADPNVTITLNITDNASGRVARLTGVYTSQVGIPTVATYPLNFQTTIDTALPPVA